MSRPTFSEWCEAGGGEIAAIYHIAGMPWAATTSADVVTALANTANADVQNFRKELFGNAAPNSYTPAYDVQIVQTLDADLGRQSLSYDEGKGITGGDWNVKLARGDNNAVYSYRTASSGGSTPPGIYAGIDIMEDTLYDSSIKRATLSANYDPFTDTTLSFGGEGASELAALITANDGLTGPTYVWMGHMCIGLFSVAGPVDGVYTADAESGCFRTPKSKIAASVTEGGTVLMANAPHAGIVGQPAVLWLVQMLNGTIAGLTERTTAAKPIMFRCGPVTNNPTLTPAEVRISHKHWLSWLDTPIPQLNLSGHLQGYRFTRQNTLPDIFDTDLHGDVVQIQMPHLLFYEWDAVGSAYVETPVWLTDSGGVTMDPGDSISFATIEELAERAVIAINAAGLQYAYTCEIGSITGSGFVDGTTNWVTGPVAWILGWGMATLESLDRFFAGQENGVWDWQYYGDSDWERALENMLFPDTFIRPKENLRMWRWIVPADLATFTYKMPMALAPFPVSPAYYYQSNWTLDNLAAAGWDPALKVPRLTDFGDRLSISSFGPGWPIPMDAGEDPSAPAPGDYRLNFDDSGKVSEIVQDDKLELGLDLSGTSISSVYYEDSNAIAAYTESSVEYIRSVWTEVNTTGDNYVQPVTTGDNQWGTSGVPILRTSDTGLDTVTNIKMLWGSDMAWFGGVDWFAPRLANKVESDTLIELLMGILGADPTNTGSYTAAAVPDRRKVGFVPDVFGPSTDTLGGYGNHRMLINLEKLDQICAGAYTDPSYSIQTASDKYTIASALLGVMLAAGVRPVWEYNENQRAWWLNFRPFGTISQSYAQQRGRTITDSDVTSSEPREVFGNTWLYNEVKLAAGYVGTTASINISVNVETGRAVIASGAKTLDIKDYWTDVQDVDLAALAGRMQSAALSFAVAMPTIELATAISALPKVGCACEILLTGETLYNPYTATRGVEKIAAMITDVGVGISGSEAKIDLTVRMSPVGQYGWSPSMRIESTEYTRSTTTLTVSGYNTDPTANLFADPAGGLTDLQTFGEFVYDESTAVTAYKSVGDTAGQRVRVVTADADSYYSSGASQNVWLGTIKGSATDMMTYADAVTNGNFRIELDSANNYPGSPMDIIVIYAPRTDANTQPSQLVYGYLGDSTGQVQDSGGTNYRAMSWSA